MHPVHFRSIDQHNLAQCLALELDDNQRHLIAPNAKSIAEAYVNPALQPFGVYTSQSLGFELPVTPMVGFVMLEVTAGVGFVLRLMIDRSFQGQGLGRASLKEAVRRLRLEPQVQLIATSHAHKNAVIANLFASEGFVPWDIAFALHHPTETYLYLPE
jgi:diamine N-acetyltransferase